MELQRQPAGMQLSLPPGATGKEAGGQDDGSKEYRGSGRQCQHWDLGSRGGGGSNREC
ncbi:MAG: hypothetical protein AMXMBFR45_25700 [Gammaproteobacteria bacterium]